MRDLLQEIGEETATQTKEPRDLIAIVGDRPNYGLDNKPDYEVLKSSLMETGKQIFEIPKSVAEVAATAGTGALGWLVGSGLGLAEATRPGSTRESVRAAYEDAAGRISYQPKTQPAQVLMEKAGRLIEGVTGPAKEAAALVGESWNSPFIEAVTKFAGELATFEAMGAAGRAVKAPQAPLWYRKMTVKERGIVEGIKTDIANGEFTATQIRELWKDPANREALLKRYQGVGQEKATPTGEAPIRASGVDVQGELPAGQGFELRPTKAEVRDLLAEMGKEGPKALPPGQGFELRPTEAEVRDMLSSGQPTTAALPYPEGVGEGFVSRPGVPEEAIVRKSGEPFKTEKGALRAGKELDWNLYEVTPQEGGGFAITRKMGREIRPEDAPKPVAEPVDEARRLRAQFDAEQAAKMAATPEKPVSASAESRMPVEKIPEVNWLETDEAAYAFSEMKSQLQNAQTKSVTEVEGETFVAESSYPLWFREVSRKHKISAKEATRIIDKITSGDRLTDRQADIFYDIERAARKEAEPYARYREQIDSLSGADQESIKSASLSEIAAEEKLSAEEFAEVSRDLDEFFTKRPAFTNETGEISGASAKETFGLINPETEISRGLKTHEKGQQTRKLFDDRGSTGPVNESEILSAILSAKGKIETAMPHLESLGRSVYEGGKTRFLDWQATIKIKLGDLWESFKGYLKDIYNRLQSGQIGPLKNQSGKVDLTPAKDTIKAAGTEIKKTADEYLGAISTRLGNIDPSIKYRLRAYEYQHGMKANNRLDKVTPFMEKVRKMPKEDRAAFDLARKNGDPTELKRLVTKHKLGKEYHETRLMLEDVLKDAQEVGYDVGRQPNYHPRIIKDRKGLIEYLYKTEEWPMMEKAIKDKEAELGRYLEEDEKAKIINTMLRGYDVGKVMLAKPREFKERRLKSITPELSKFYMDSDEALVTYIRDTTSAIEAKRLFNPGSKDKLGDMKATIGGYVLKLLNEKKITPAQEKELVDILNARFNEVGTRGMFSLGKNLSYIDTMGNPIQALTQIGDLAWSLYENGIARTVADTTKAVVGKSRFKKEDIGIAKIAAEFSERAKSAKAVDAIFKAIGLLKIDNIGKETLINGVYAKARDMAVNNPQALRKELQPIFEGQTNAVIQDFVSGKITENVKLYLFNKLTDFQPVALSEMPEKYLTGGNGRIFYMLKTFQLKMFDVFRRECFQKIATPGTRVEGIKNLVKLASAFAAANATADVIKDLILGRPIELSDLVADNLLRLAGVSKFVFWKAKEEGVGEAIMKQIAPPHKLADALTKDISTAGDEKGLESVQSIPIVGKFYYWWFGKGAKKSADRRTKARELKKPNLKGLQ